jgi:hypothetical protein
MATKDEIIEILKKHQKTISNHARAIFEDDFESIASDISEGEKEKEDMLIDFGNWYLRLCKVITDSDCRFEIENREIIWSFLRGDDYKLWWEKGESLAKSSPFGDKEVDKVTYLKLILKQTLELYYKEKSRPRGFFRTRLAVAHFEGKDALKDAGIISKSELALSGMYDIGEGKWENELGDVIAVKIDMP